MHGEVEAVARVSEIVGDSVHVLAGRQLREGQPSPRFGDDIWDLNGIVHMPTARQGIARLNFGLIEDQQLRIVAKELLYARLNELPGASKNAAPTTASSVLYSFRTFARFASETSVDLERIRQIDLDAYLDRLGEHLKPTSRTQYVSVLKDLHRLRGQISYVRFINPPWRMRPVQIITGVDHDPENLRPRIPEIIMQPLLAHSLLYVEVAANDILKARKELEGYLLAKRPSRADASDRLQAWCDRRSQAGRGIPKHLYPNRGSINGRSGEYPPNIKQCLLMAGIASDRPSARMTQILSNYEEKSGYESGGFDVEISVDPETGRPWRERFDRDSITKESRKLVTACYIITAYLSGMRDSEVQSLKRGCASVLLDKDGEPLRYRVRGTIWKGEIETGRTGTWVVLPEVIRAITILEQLSDSEEIFVALSHRSGVVGRMIGSWLNSFLADAITYDAEENGSDLAVPEWRLATGQFRRTVAWHIANRPFGVIAGMLQYKHVRIATFEGYAGTSESGFRAEVLAEEEDFKVRDVLDQYQDHLDGAATASLGGERLARRFDDIRQASGDFPGMIVDARRRDVMLRRVASEYYAGQFNDCHFDETFALCLKESSVSNPGQKAVPLINACSPSTCANSTLRPHHARAWEGQLASARDLLTTPGLGETQKRIIEGQIFPIEDMLRRLR